MARKNLTIRVGPGTAERLRVLASANGRSIGAVIDLVGLSATPEDLAIFDLRRARLSAEPPLSFQAPARKGAGE